jgi:RHS repeat-associated protein
MATSGSAPCGTPNLQAETKTYTTNNLNQYNEITKNPEPSTTYLSYDFDGNLIQINDSSNGINYFYDGENRLIRVEPQMVTSGTTKVECFYDYICRRVEKKAFIYQSGNWQLATDTLFIYDGFNIIQEQTTVTGQTLPIKSYINGLDLSQSMQGAGGIGGLITSIQNNSSYFYCYDSNGNVGQLIDSMSGTIAAHYEYDPYGNITVESGALAKENPFCYSSKYFDQETGLLYYGYRYYDSKIGRWISRDPIGENGGQNLYAFVKNDPINKIDIYGLSVDEDGVRSGRYKYTCNCGWLDKSHYQDYSQKYNKIYAEMIKNRRGSVELLSSIPARFGFGDTKGRLYSWDLRSTNIDYFYEAMTKLSQAGTQEELDQSGAGFGLLGGWTAFSFEDMASNMFGGLIAKIMIKNKLSFDEALAQALKDCVEVSLDEALTVFEANKQILEHGTNKGAKQTEMTCDPCKKKHITPYPEWEHILKITNP